MSLKQSEYLSAFLEDADELLQNLDDNLLVLEKEPRNEDTINKLFRIAHTLKGNSGMMGFSHVKEFTHSLESVISLLRSGQRELDHEMFELLFTSFGFLRATVQHLKEKGEENEAEITTQNLEILHYLRRADGTQDPKTTAVATTPSDGVRGGHKEFQLGHTIRVDVDRMDALLDSVGELVINRTHAIELVESCRSDTPSPVDSKVQAVAEVLQRQGRILSSVQEAIMKARMIPIRYLFDRCPRIARNLANKLGKRVEVTLEGSTTELDKKMIDALSEPLLHLISNAVDHGVELPDVRKSQGKPETGTIKISAYSEHNQVVVTVSDDGRGVDVKRLASKMKKHAPAETPEAGKLSAAEIFNALSTPGFSLAEKITDISGRGVGLDVVRARIEEVNGSIELVSESGIGTRFLIRLPLTLAIIQAVLVEYRHSTFAIPLGFVQEVVTKDDGIIRNVEGQGAILELREELLPVVSFDTALDFDEGSAEDWSFLVIAGIPKRRVAIPVHRLLGDQEIVMKTLNPLVGVSRFISGASVLGDGRIVMIVDVFSLFNL